MDILVEDQAGTLWAAALEKRKLEGIEIDPAAERVRWGSVYRARVSRIDAALDAAFVDLDGENEAILYAADVRVEGRRAKGGKGRGKEPGGHKAIGKLLQPGQMVAVQAKSGYLPRGALADAEDLPAENKITRASMDITLAGRHLVYAPAEQDNRISSRIRDRKTRAQLQEMLDALEDVHGCILRAAALSLQTDVLRREARVLRATWDQLHRHLSGDSPQLVMRGPDAFHRLLSDHAADKIGTITVHGETALEHALEWCEVYAPDLVARVDAVEEDIGPSSELALLTARDVLDQVEALLRPYVLLPDGGNIILQETAALMAVDVNAGTDRGSKLSVNLQAAAEIARQIRLRNIGGIVMVDFLKSKTAADRTALEKALAHAFDSDACTVQVHGLTALGLLEITRARRTPPLRERLEAIFDD
ncbi:MAG TPA: ribonuclease E/G [Alphaproteobacteria bacterium]|nr:ribonuclease E/G [Alphaproteobacteria bacterium]